MDTFTLSELQVLTAQHMFLSHLEYDIYTQLNLMAFNMLVKQTWTDLASLWKPCTNIRRRTFRHSIQRSQVNRSAWFWSATRVALWRPARSVWRTWRITWVSEHQWCQVYSKYWTVTCDTETINTMQAILGKLLWMLWMNIALDVQERSQWNLVNRICTNNLHISTRKRSSGHNQNTREEDIDRFFLKNKQQWTI
jgi:hypothetical protein